MALSAGSVFVDVLPNTAKFGTLLQAQMAGVANKAGQSFSQKLGSNLSTVGRNMTKYVTLPVVAAGAASVKMAVDFETSFTRIRANSNLTEKQITNLRGEVLKLAGKTAQSPQELGDALYFLASAGLNAKQVTQTLEQAAKGSAAGFGETSVIARLTANALNAYAKSGLEASTVTDNLAAAVREGTAEPDEFADALGRVLPVASKAKVSFADVTASLASLSNIGLPVTEGVTGINSALSNLLSPGVQATDTLKEFGLTADEVRDSIAKDGILGVFRLLEEATEGDIDALRKIIPNIRGMRAAFGLTEQEANKVTASFDRVKNSTGDMDKAFGEVKKSTAYQMQQLLADLQVTAIKLGTKALPVLRDVVKTVSDMLDSFSKLSPETQGAIVKFTLLAAAAGPLLRIFGPMVGLIGRVTAGFVAMATSATAAATASTAAGAAATASQLPAAGAGGVSAARLAARLPRGLGAAAPAITATGVSAGAAATAVNILGAAVVAFAIAQKRATDASTAAEAEITKYGKHSEAAAEEVRQLENDARGLGKAALLSDARIAEATETHRHYTGVLVGNSKALETFRGWLRNTENLTDKQTVTLANNVDALYKMGGALSATRKQQISNLLAVGDYRGALKILDEALDRVSGKHRNLDDSLRNTRDQVAANEGRVKAYVAGLDRIPKDKKTKVNLDASQAHAELNDWAKAVRDISGLVNVRLEARGVGDGPGAAGGGIAADWANQAMVSVPGAQFVSSGYRSPAQNAAVGGSPTSYHLDRSNPAQDIVGSNLSAVAAFLSRFPYRELLWQVPGHYDHVHVADKGGWFKGPGMLAMGKGEEYFAGGLQKSGTAGPQKVVVELRMKGDLKEFVDVRVYEGNQSENRWARSRTRVG